MDEQKRQQFRQASAEELRQALERGELTGAEYQYLYRDVAKPTHPLRTVLLVTAALFGLGILIFCGGCGLMLSKGFR